MFAWLRSLFGPSPKLAKHAPAVSPKNPAIEGGPIIHIHEDDCGMRNLYPLAAMADAVRDMQISAETAERSQHPSGFGWSEMHMIQPPETDFGDCGLTVAMVASVVEPIMPRVRRFAATSFSYIGSDEIDPYGGYESDAWAFGLGPECYLKAEVENDLVKAIWFDLNSTNAKHVDSLRQSIEAIDRLVPSVISDYFLRAIVPVADASLLDNYFAARVDQMVQPTGARS